MLAAWMLLQPAQARSERRTEIDADGELWVYFPYCGKCGKMFAVPAEGATCCVCLAANS